MANFNEVLLYGASGHCKVVTSIFESRGVKVKGVFDDNLSIDKLNLVDFIGVYDSNYNLQIPLVISIGDNKVRKNLANKIKHKFVTGVHTSVIIDEFVSLGEGTVVMQSSTLQRDVIIGKHCIVNTNASIDHDCKIDDFVHIAPGATLCGSIEVGEGTMIGANATILPNVKIGKWCIIGAGTVVIRDIPSYSIVVGTPGRIIKTDYHE